MQKFRKYYLLPLIGLGSIALFGWYQNQGTIDFKFGFFLFFVGIISPLLIGRLRDWAQNTWTPKKRAKVYKEEPFLSLEKIGFSNYEDFYFEGVYDGYTVYVVYDHSWMISVNFIFFYEPEEITDQAYNVLLKKMVGTKFQSSLLGNIVAKIETNFKVCSFEKIEKQLKEGVDFLRKNDLNPISPKKLQQIYEKLQSKKK